MAKLGMGGFCAAIRDYRPPPAPFRWGQKAFAEAVVSARGPRRKSRGRAYLDAACALGAASAQIAWVGLGWLAATPAQAQSNYPWCAYYGGGNYGTNCGFTTFEQCLEYGARHRRLLPAQRLV